MNCRNCTHFNVKKLAQRDLSMAKYGHGYCDKHAGLLPMAGCFCADWVEAKAESVQARETFWRSR